MPVLGAVVAALRRVVRARVRLGAVDAILIANDLSVSRSLTECNLRGNGLGDVGWCAVFDTLRDNPQNKIVKWDLADQGINPTIAKSLAAYMAVSGSLTKVLAFLPHLFCMHTNQPL